MSFVGDDERQRIVNDCVIVLHTNLPDLGRYGGEIAAEISSKFGSKGGNPTHADVVRYGEQLWELYEDLAHSVDKLSALNDLACTKISHGDNLKFQIQQWATQFTNAHLDSMRLAKNRLNNFLETEEKRIVALEKAKPGERLQGNQVVACRTHHRRRKMIVALRVDAQQVGQIDLSCRAFYSVHWQEISKAALAKCERDPSDSRSTL